MSARSARAERWQQLPRPAPLQATERRQQLPCPAPPKQQRRWDRERGQSMPMAAVGLFAVVLGVLATLNLGQAVHQKIKLQNTADSAAYSLAAMEARTFNYIAFLNRAQIAHYNTAAVVQSYMSWVGFQVAVFGMAVDICTTVKNAAKMGSMTTLICKLGGPRCLYSVMHGILEGVVGALEGLREALVQLVKVTDKIGHWIVEAMGIFNKDAVYQSQFARAALLNGHILYGMQSYIFKLDKDLKSGKGKNWLLNMAINSALNSIEYYQTFDNASGINPYAFSIPFDLKRIGPSGAYTKRSEDKAKDAHRIMAELCHASRTPQFVSNREDNINFVIPWAAAFPFHFVRGDKLGQTKFTEKKSMKNARIKAIDNEKNYPVAGYLSSDDFIDSVQGYGFAMVGHAFVVLKYSGSDAVLGDAIEAYESNGKHYRYTGPDNTSMTKISPDGKNVTVVGNGNVDPGGVAKSYKSAENHAPWTGFAPYFKFRPNKDRTRDFNQPSTWIFLNKHHQDFQSRGGSHAGGGSNKRAPWYGNFSWHNGDQVAKLNTAIGGSRNSYFFEGLNVISRGMAYYHRPGNWTEHPNFFNPYWRARLAPVGQKLQNFWDRWVTSKISTKSEDKAVRAMVAALRNFQMDLITEFITSLITH